MNKQLEVLKPETGAVERAQPTSLSLLEAVISGGVTSENVALVKELTAMRREEIAAQSKTSFNRDFFDMKKEISGLNFYADKEAKSRDGSVMYAYCSESELSEKLEPVLKRHNFAMLFSQERSADTVTAVVTLIHRDGHEHVSRYTVRVGSTNAAKDATAADAGSTTSAWRHLVMKLFGLKSRISEENDPRNLGEHITEEQAADLERRVMDTASDSRAFLRFAGVKIGPDEEITADHYRSIMSSKLAVLDDNLRRKEGRK